MRGAPCPRQRSRFLLPGLSFLFLALISQRFAKNQPAASEPEIAARLEDVTLPQGG